MKTMELCPASNGREGEAEEHGIEEDEARDGGIGVFAQDHEGDEPDGGTFEVQFASGEVGKRDGDNAEQGIEDSHEGVIELRGVGFTRLELEGSVVTSEISGQAHEHLAQRRVDIKVELAL